MKYINMGKNLALVIIIAIGVIVLLCCMMNSKGMMETYKDTSFPGSSPYRSAANLDEYYEGSTKGVEDYLVDNLTCHPDCCGDQWPVPFDGLTSREVEHCIETRGTPGPFVRTNYTCANGINGVGCPCIPKKVYMLLADHGKIPRPEELQDIEPTFLIRNNNIPDGTYEGVKKRIQSMMSPYEEIQSRRSMFVDTPKLNDLEYQRSETDLSNVQSYKSSIQPKYKQLERVY